MKIEIYRRIVEVPDGLSGEELEREILRQKKLIRKTSKEAFKGSRWNDRDWNEDPEQELPDPDKK